MTAGRKFIGDSQHWCTPPKYVDAVKNFFQEIELDPCSNAGSIVGAKVEYRLPENDGLRDSWDYKTIYVNPPYGRSKDSGTSIYDWISRCHQAFVENQSEVLALIPVAVNTKHWKRFIFGGATSICFLADTRLKFINGANDKGAPMACAIIYWGVNPRGFYDIFSNYGAVLSLTELQSRGWVSPDLRIDPDEDLFS